MFGCAEFCTALRLTFATIVLYPVQERNTVKNIIEGEGIMISDVASRDRYLTLALFSRRIIEALRELVRTGDRGRLQTALPAAIESLQAATDSRHSGGYAVRVARSYDQVRTINELFPKKEERLGMIRTLEGLRSDAGRTTQKEDALKAIRFFYAIENRALHNYRHPSRARIVASK